MKDIYTDIIARRSEVPTPSLGKLASEFGLSRQRISQILHEYGNRSLCGIKATPAIKVQTCNHCGKSFESQARDKYCSDECRTFGRLLPNAERIAADAIESRPTQTWAEITERHNLNLPVLLRYVRKYADVKKVNVDHCFVGGGRYSNGSRLTTDIHHLTDLLNQKLHQNNDYTRSAQVSYRLVDGSYVVSITTNNSDTPVDERTVRKIAEVQRTVRDWIATVDELPL